VVEKFGYTAGLLGVTAVGLLAVVIVLAFMPETKPGKETRRAGCPPAGSAAGSVST